MLYLLKFLFLESFNFDKRFVIVLSSGLEFSKLKLLYENISYMSLFLIFS